MIQFPFFMFNIHTAFVQYVHKGITHLLHINKLLLTKDIIFDVILNYQKDFKVKHEELTQSDYIHSSCVYDDQFVWSGK